METKYLANTYSCEEILPELSDVFATIAAPVTKQIIEWALQHIAECLDIDRCGFWKVAENLQEIYLIHQFARPEFAKDPPVISNENFPKMFAQALTGVYFYFNRLEDIGSEALIMKDIFRRLGVKSGLLIPYNIAGKTNFVMTFDSIRKEITFTPDIFLKLKMAGEIITGTYYRSELEEKYQASLQEMEKILRKHTKEEIPLAPTIKEELIYENIIGNSPAMQLVLSRIEQVAQTDSAVLIQGETGTGKNILAALIHDISQRKNKRLVTVNCAALPQNLLESELFGREKGAFTGADSRQIGRFELADRGTLILDEIGELPLELQAKLLRAIQDGELERLGSPQTIKVDVRIIALTGKNLQEEAARKRFRQDLFYRLNVFPVSVPPLRERREDIPHLVQHFLQEFNRKMNREINFIPDSIMNELMIYSWPGNVRELRHVIERSVITTSGNSLQLREKFSNEPKSADEDSFITNLAEVEKHHICKVLEKTNWRIDGPKGAAILLGLHPNTLRGRMAKLGINLKKTIS